MGYTGSFQRLSDVLGEEYVSLASLEEKGTQEDSSLCCRVTLQPEEDTEHRGCLQDTRTELVRSQSCQQLEPGLSVSARIRKCSFVSCPGSVVLSDCPY